MKRTQRRAKKPTPEVLKAQLLIERAGGIAGFAELLGLTGEDFWKQKVTNWRSRGIPPKVQLAHFDTLRKLSDQSNAA